MKKLIGIFAFVILLSMCNGEVVYASNDLQTSESRAVIASGECGDSMGWKIEDKCLYIYGSGDMYDFDLPVNAPYDPETESTDDNPPWENYADDIESIVISGDVKSIGKHAFCWMKKVNQVDFRTDALETIGERAFVKSSIRTISLPESVKTIKANAFADCFSLTNVQLNEGLEVIGENAFIDDFELASIVIPSTVKVIEGNHTFESAVLLVTPNSKGYEYAINNTHEYYLSGGTCGSSLKWNINGIKLHISGNGKMNDFDLPSYSPFNPETTTKADNPPWEDVIKFVDTVVIGDEVTYIGKNAFSDANIKYIEGGVGIEKIGEGAFYRCDLTDFCAPENLKEIGKSAFSNCFSLNYISLNDGLETIGYGAFVDTEASRINIPASVTYIERLAFPESVLIYVVENTYGHTYVKEHQYKYETQKCTHKWETEYTLDTKATFTTNGAKSFHCKWCDAANSKKVVIPRIAEIKLSETKFIFNNQLQRPDVIVKDVTGNILLGNIDYTVVYKDSIDEGRYSVITNFIGNYGGGEILYYTIEKPSISNAIVTLSDSQYTYDGKAKKPAVTVTLNGQKLKKDIDYTVTYSNNKNIGTAKVTITGKENYTGTISKTFTIKAKKGASFTSGKYKYKVTDSSTVDFNGIVSTKTTKVTIPKTVKYGGKTFKVTAIADGALKKKTKVTQVTVGANVKTIGVSAFEGCKNLKTIKITSAKLKTVGKEAFKGINAKATIKVPRSKLKSYLKLLKGKGQESKVKIVKY